jgi:glycolate oxidase FAD binding subunit
VATETLVTERPGSPKEAADLLRGLAADKRVVRPRGGGTKLAWGAAGDPVAVELETGGMNRILEHNEGDLTAVLEPGVPLGEAQSAFADKGQMLALDPPLGRDDAATVGGLVATGDSGPLRHRYGGVRDLVVGISVALSDGTLAKAGGKVIKNVAGYDLAKLFTGSYGTLGLIVGVNVRLHPLQTDTATASGGTEDPERLAAALATLARLPLEADCLDVAWRGHGGRVLVRFGGAAAEHQAEITVKHMREAGLDDAEAIAGDAEVWTAQRAGQRSEAGAVLKVSGRTSDLAAVIGATRDADGALVGRAAQGLYWIVLEGDGLAERAAHVRSALEPRACVLTDAPAAVREAVDPWGPVDPGALAVMRRVKERFDPARILRPGAFVGGI